MTGQQELERALRELERHVAEQGWDQPTRLFALVPAADLALHEPELASSLQAPAEAGELVQVEQEDLPDHDDVASLLGEIGWPDGVSGVAIVAERIMLPDDVDTQLPSDVNEARHQAAKDPDRHELRMAVAVLRGGERFSLLRLRRHDSDEAVLAGHELVSGLADMLLATLEDY